MRVLQEESLVRVSLPFCVSIDYDRVSRDEACFAARPEALRWQRRQAARLRPMGYRIRETRLEIALSKA